MKKFYVFLLVIAVLLSFSACGEKNNSSETAKNYSEASDKEDNSTDLLKEGDLFKVIGKVEYSDDPSDIGQEYCFIEGDVVFEYYYEDIYAETSKWSSDTFYTKGNDTVYLKEYVGREVTISGSFEAESHGIPYITNVSVVTDENI